MALPSTPLLDDFSRPNEDPLSNQGRWTQMDTALAGTGLQVLSNRCLAVAGGEGHRYWSPISGLKDTEVWGVVTNISNVRYLWARVNNPGGNNAVDAYVALSQTGSITAIHRITDGSFNQIASVSVSGSFAAGDVMVMRVVGFTITVYRVRSGGVNQILSATDDTAQCPSGGIGIGAFNAGQFGNFGGGDLNVEMDGVDRTIGGRGGIP